MAGLPIFPSLIGLAFPVTRQGPTFDTVVQQAVSGKTTTLPKRITPTWTWELSFEFLRTDAGRTELQTLAAFYASRFGRAYAFGYVDAEDNQATNQLFGLGNGVATVFQLVRSWGGFVEPVFLPTTLPAIMVGGALLTLGTDYTLAVGGVVTFVKPPASGAQLTWTGPFAWACRFDQDNVKFSNFMTRLWSVDKLSFTSLIL